MVTNGFSLFGSGAGAFGAVLATDADAAATAATEASETAAGFDWSVVWSKLTDFAVTAGAKIILALVVLLVGKLVIRVLMRFIRRSRAMKRADVAVSRFLVNFFKIAFDVILIVMVVSILGVPMTSIVAVLTAAAAAIGLAMQGALGNFAGGIMILIFHPFRLDDFIDAGGFSGTVMDIGIFYTVLKTPDNREITIPNGSIMSQAIINLSAHSTRRLDLQFTVAYGTDIDKVRAALIETAEANRLVLPDPAPFARLTSNEESALKFTLRVWVKRTDYWTANFDLIEQVNRRFAADGIRIPFNQLDVHVIPTDKHPTDE